MVHRNEHVQAVREGRPYISPALAINHTIDGLVHSALVIRQSEDGALLTPEARALDAIGVQVERELKNRAEMIHALSDTLVAKEAELRAVREQYYDAQQGTQPIVAERELTATQ